MKKKYNGNELLQATQAGLIHDESMFISKSFPGLVFVYSEGFLSDYDDDFTNYWIMENGISIDGCLADVMSGKDYNSIIFKLYKHTSIKLKLKRLFCKHIWEDGSNLPGCQSFKCAKCGKEIFWSPFRGWFK